MPSPNTTITADRIRELLHYDPETGVFTRRVRSGPAMPGDVAGGPYGNGYAGISLDNVVYFSHRLAWQYVHGEIPEGAEVCFKRGADKSRPRIADLYLYVRARRWLYGVTPSGNRFEANISVGGRMKFLGSFTTERAANRAALKAKRERDRIRRARP